MKTYRYIQDPGHGWIEVPRAELTALGIADKISLFSYQSGNGKWAYLEEDSDAAKWTAARAAAGNPVSRADMREEHTNNDSPIRNLERYRPRTNLRAQTKACVLAAVGAP